MIEIPIKWKYRGRIRTFKIRQIANSQYGYIIDLPKDTKLIRERKKKDEYESLRKKGKKFYRLSKIKGVTFCQELIPLPLKKRKK